MKSYTCFLTALFAFTTSVYGSFNASNLVTMLPQKGAMMTAQSDNSLYLFGGVSHTNRHNSDLYKLNLSDNIYNWEVLPQANTPDGTVLGQGYVTSDNQNLVLMGGSTEANEGSVQDFKIYTYNFASQNWAENPLVKDDALAFPSMKAFSATYNPKTQQTYVLSGYNTTGAYLINTFWQLDANFKATAMTPPYFGRFDHSASLTSEGKIVILGGVTSNNGLQHVDMRSALVFDTSSNMWETVNIAAASGNFYPSARSAHTAVIDSDDQIIIFGGQGDDALNPRYLNDIAILDTKTWTWAIPTISGTPPSNRSGASCGILDGKTLTVGFGGSTNSTYYNDINVYDFSTSSWIQNFNESSSNGSSRSPPDNSNGESPSHSSSGVSKGLIAGVTVAGVVVVLIIAFLLWKFKCCSGCRSWAVRDRVS